MKLFGLGIINRLSAKSMMRTYQSIQWLLYVSNIAFFFLTGLEPDISPDEQEEKARLIAQVLELQNTLDGKCTLLPIHLYWSLC